MDPVAQFAAEYANLSDETLSEFKQLFSLKKYKKGDVIVRVGEKHHKISLLTQGIGRSFITDKKGNEHIRTLFLPISVVCSVPSLVEKKPSNSEYDCLTDCILLEANFDEFIALTKRNHEVSMLHNRTLEKAYIRIENRIVSLSTMDATERYLELKNQAPDIENQIPLYHIAAYLNITPIQLSRIRKSLYSK